LPEVKDIFVNIGHDAVEKTERAFGDFEPNTAEMTVLLKEERRRSVEDMVDVLRAEISKIKDVQTEFILNQNVGQMLKQKQQAPEILEISGPDFKMIQDITTKVLAELSKIECLKDVKSNLDEDETEIQITVDREKAATYRLTVKNIADTLKTAIKGDVATQYYHADEETDIVVKLRKEDTEDMNQLEKILVHTPFNTTIPLSEVTKISIATRLREIQHRDLKRVSIIFANIVGVAFDDAVEKVRDRLKKIKLPSDYFFSLSDEQQEMNQSFKGLIFALGLSIILVYMLLASLFESFLNPFIIMFAVPLAAVGVILILFVFRIPISLGVFIGSIMLGGIVVNNSIILLDYTERLRKKGLSSMDAIVTAGRIRLRPILMTALTTILGLAPLASGFGGGSEIRQPLALTVIGGLSTSTFMTLVIIPVIYALFHEMKTKPTQTAQIPKIKPVKG
jgi:HAE1 family hydrophobic/amphiphilic exporter-1